MLRVHSSVLRRLGWLGAASSVNVTPSSTVVSTSDMSTWTYVGSSQTGQNVYQRSDGSIVVGNGAGQYVVATVNGSCTPTGTWYQNNGDGTYTRYIYAESACGGAVISAAEYQADTGTMPASPTPATSGAQSSGATGSATQGSAAAVTPSGTPISTQTGTALRLISTTQVSGAPGVYQCQFSDGSQNYCDVDGNPITYTPPSSTPAVTPAAASQPTATVSPTVTPVQAPAPTVSPAPTAVTPSGQVINTTTGDVQPATVATTAATSSDIMLGSFDLTQFLNGSLLGIPMPYVLLGGGAAILFLMFSGSGSGSTSRRRNPSRRRRSRHS